MESRTDGERLAALEATYTYVATKSDIAELRTDFDNLRSEVKDVRSEVKDVRSEVKDIRSDLDDLRSEVKDLRIDFESFRSEITGGLKTLKWMLGGLIAVAAGIAVPLVVALASPLLTQAA